MDIMFDDAGVHLKSILLLSSAQSSVSETKNEGTTPNANIATALSSSDVNVSPNEKTKLDSVKNSKRIAFISRNEVCPLKAIIYRSSKIIDVTVSLSKEAYNTSIATNQLVTTQKKSTPTVPHTKQFHKTPNHHSKMFVTPTSSYNYNTPVSSIRRAIQTTRDIKNPADKLEYDFSKYERQASEFHKNVGMLFPEIVHAMVTNASTTIPCVLHWDGDGDRFVVEKVVRFIKSPFILNGSIISTIICHCERMQWRLCSSNISKPINIPALSVNSTFTDGVNSKMDRFITHCFIAIWTLVNQH